MCVHDHLQWIRFQYGRYGYVAESDMPAMDHPESVICLPCAACCHTELCRYVRRKFPLVYASEELQPVKTAYGVTHNQLLRTKLKESSDENAFFTRT
nr:hypothetical protein HmN_000007700 [Hymenolepis microstoma]